MGNERLPLLASDKQLLRRISRLMVQIRTNRQLPPALFSEGGYFRIPVCIGGIHHEMPLGFVGTVGCRWAKRGGCVMCDYGGYEGFVPDSALIKQASVLLDQWVGDTEICLSSLGSFFDDNELSPNARSGILLQVAQRPSISLLGVDSRAEHISLEKIRIAKEILGERVCFEVGIGLESYDTFVRNVCVNKGLALSVFEKAVDIIRSNGAYVVGHVLLKPPFLTEREAVDDAVATVEYLDSVGCRRIVMMVCNVKENTLTGELHKQHLYRPPWLWSVLQVALSIGVRARSKLLIYGFRCGLPMVEMGHNCPKCDSEIMGKISKFCGERADSALREAYAMECECKKGWRKELDFVGNESLRVRVEKKVEILEIALAKR